MLTEWLGGYRDLFDTATRDGPLWPTERSARLTLGALGDRFAQYRDALGLPAELSLHCLRHSYVTHLIETGYDALFVQQQVGHSYASTTALYTSVSSHYRTRTLRRVLDGTVSAALTTATTKGSCMARRLNFHWNLRQLMAAHEIWKTTELIPLLDERGVRLSTAQVYRLVTDKPERLSLKTLTALCDILSCTPADLIDPYVEVSSRKPAVGEATVIDVRPEFRPQRARVVDDE